jgi:hypothetical protein
LAALAALPSAGCGGDDVTTLTNGDGSELAPAPEPVAEQSRTFSVLAAPESLDAVCRIIGVSSSGGAGDREACAMAVDECRGDVAAALGTGDPTDIGVPAADLEPWLGCPLTLAELDACIGAALSRGVEEYGSSIGCDMPVLPAVDPIRLFGSAECIAVVLRCPELIANLLPEPARAPRATDPR